MIAISITDVRRAQLHDGKGISERTMARRQTPSLTFVPAPPIASREVLLRDRQRKNRPDASFDVDGDGFVDPIELMVGSLLDTDNDGKLSQAERENAGALIARLRKHYVFGLEVRSRDCVDQLAPSRACVSACSSGVLCTTIRFKVSW